MNVTSLEYINGCGFFLTTDMDVTQNTSLRYGAAMKVRTSIGEYRILLKHRASTWGLPTGCIFDLLRVAEEVSNNSEKSPELLKKKRPN